MAGKIIPTRGSQARVAQMAEAGRRLQAQQATLREFMAGHQRRLSDLEHRFQGQFQDLTRSLDQWKQYEEQSIPRHEALRRDQERLALDLRELDRRRGEIDDHARDIELRSQDTEAQRQRIAKNLDERRRKLLGDQANDRAAWEAQLLESQDALRDQEEKTRRLEAEKLRTHDATLALAQAKEALESELQSSRALISSLESETNRLQSEAEELRAACARHAAAPQLDPREIAQLRAERNAFEATCLELQATREALNAELLDARQRMVELKTKVEATPEQDLTASSADATAELDAVRRELSMAIESVEALRAKNDRLEEQLDEALASSAERADCTPATDSIESAQPEATDEGPLDWEAQKRRLMSLMEDENIGTDDHSRIEEALCRADKIIEQHQREVAELREQLESEIRTGDPRIAERQAEVDQLLDADAAILAEREKLTILQAEWQQKLSDAEVACARERAQNARMRSELEEKLRDVEAELNRMAGSEGRSGKAKPSGRRWLDHLGLGKDDDKGK
ncbi:MAG TPA: hypothetical protein VIY86_07415 [Pirellulaceae bacterium]